MSEEEKQAIKELKHYGNMTSYYKEREYTDIQIEKYIDTVLNLIEKQNKVIDKMAQEIFIEYNPHFSTPEQVKEYFYKEIKNE